MKLCSVVLLVIYLKDFNPLKRSKINCKWWCVHPGSLVQHRGHSPGTGQGGHVHGQQTAHRPRASPVLRLRQVSSRVKWDRWQYLFHGDGVRIQWDGAREWVAEMNETLWMISRNETIVNDSVSLSCAECRPSLVNQVCYQESATTLNILFHKLKIASLR